MPAGAERAASSMRLVYGAFTGLLRERLGGRDVRGWDLTMALFSTFMSTTRRLTRPPGRRQHGQLRVPGAALAPENNIVKETMHHLEKNSNKNMLSWTHARSRKGTTKVRRQKVAHSATSKKDWVGGRVGLRQGPSSLNPAGVNGLIPAKK